MAQTDPHVDSLTQLTALTDKLTDAKAEKKKFETDLKEANAEIEKLEDQIYKLMQEHEVDQIAIRNRIFFPIVQTFPKVLDQDKFYDFLRDRGEDGIIKETVHPQTLRAWYNGLEDDERKITWREELLTGQMLEAYEKIRIGDRKRG